MEGIEGWLCPNLFFLFLTVFEREFWKKKAFSILAGGESEGKAALVPRAFNGAGKELLFPYKRLRKAGAASCIKELPLSYSFL